MAGAGFFRPPGPGAVAWPCRVLRRFLFVLLCFAFALPASAAPRDSAAKKKIDEAINKHYVVTEFDQAEQVLQAAVNACGSQCSPAVLAKAWMYIGLVRGSGKNNQKAAKEAFLNALTIDPAVALDDALATPATKKTFAAVRKETGAGTAAPPSGTDLGEGGGDGPEGGVECAFKLTEVQTRRPVPVSCTAAENVKKLDLKYKAGSEGWKSVKMKKKKGAFRATIPCTATGRAGKLRFYVRAEDENGDPAGGFGKKSQPKELAVVKQSEEEPPAFPDEEPPKRCSKSAVETTAACESSDDCDEGECVEGKCEAPKEKKKATKGKEVWVGLQFAYDFAIVGGTEVCSLESQREQGFACFYKDTEAQYPFEPHPRYANEIQTGISPATARALVSLQYLVTPNIAAGVRVGYAFGGGPPSGKQQEVKFLPYHFEVRGSYLFGDADSGVRPYVGAQGGAGQVDAKLPVSIGDCAGTPGGAASKPGAKSAQDFAYYQSCSQGNATPARLEVDAYKKLGKGFAGIHGGALFMVSPESGIQLDVAFNQMLPTTGQVIEPSLGYVIGL